MLNLKGIQCMILVGGTDPLPAPLTDAVQSIEVTHTDSKRSGFQMVFATGRGGPSGITDYPILQSSLLKPFSRITIFVVFNTIPRMIMDGMITHVQLNPGKQPGSATVTVTGEDISIMLDRVEKKISHPAQTEFALVTKLIADSNYTSFNLVPQVIPPKMPDTPNPIERVPMQHGSDLDYLVSLAERCGYVFFVATGPMPFKNTAYWGPPRGWDISQPALSVNMNAASNVSSIHFVHNGLRPVKVKDQILDTHNGQVVPITALTGSRMPLLSRDAVMQVNSREILLDKPEGLTPKQAQAQAQAIVDASQDDVVVAEGEIDVLRYMNVLQARALVGLRGVGDSYNGLYYVKRVSHQLLRGIYRQTFTLTRDGAGKTVPALAPQTTMRNV